MKTSLNNPNFWVSWVRMFDIPDVSKHKDGFTIYKIVSLLYPKSCPDAVTKVTVWKRFNDFKKLHREIKSLLKKHNITDVIPSLPKSVLFKRFDEETINQRKRGILNFLEFIGNHSVLFTSTVFVKFFETSHTPVELLNSNINLIRSGLGLPEENDFAFNSDDERNISDTDSFTSSTLGSMAQSLDLTADSNCKVGKSNLKKLNSMTSIDSHSSKASESCMSTIDNFFLFDGQYSTPPTTPGSSGFPEEIQYLVDASMHVNLAVELETDKKYEEAYVAYKTAVDILLNSGKDETDYDRKKLVHYKTEKYLIRAEKIYNMYLAPEVKHLHMQKIEEVSKSINVKGRLFNLYKYKVIKIIPPSRMLVLHSEQQQIFFIKVIHKTVQFLDDNLILPENVPYMVKLVNHYNCENALFLVLEYCSGPKLRDYIKGDLNTTQGDQLLSKIEEQSDNESEISFSEVINEYNFNRMKVESRFMEQQDSDSDDSFEKIEISDVASANISDSAPNNCTAVNSSKQNTNSKGLVSSSTEVNTNLKKLNEFSSSDSAEESDCKSSASEEQIVKWASQLLIALEKLHCLGIICRDLTINNLLVDNKGDLVLTYKCNIKDLCDLYSNGINLNLAPEVYSIDEISDAVDWWSFGAILYELLVGMPLNKLHPSGITSYTRLKIPKYVSVEGRSVLKQLLAYDPQNRLGSGKNGTEHLKSHPFFRTVSWATFEEKFS